MRHKPPSHLFMAAGQQERVYTHRTMKITQERLVGLVQELSLAVDDLIWKRGPPRARKRFNLVLFAARVLFEVGNIRLASNLGWDRGSHRQALQRSPVEPIEPRV